VILSNLWQTGDFSPDSSQTGPARDFFRKLRSYALIPPDFTSFHCFSNLTAILTASSNGTTSGVYTKVWGGGHDRVEGYGLG